MADLNNLMLLSLVIWREECALVPVNVHMQSKIRGKGDKGKIGVKRAMTGCGYGKNKPVEGLHQRINGAGWVREVGSQTRAEDGQRAAAARRWRAGTDGGAARYASAGWEAGGAGAGSRGADTGGGRPASGGSEEVEGGNRWRGCTVRECRPGSRRGGSGKPGRGYGWRAANKRRQQGGGGRECATRCGPGSKWGGCGKPAAVPGSAAAAGSQRGAASERWEQEGGSEEMRRLRWGARRVRARKQAGRVQWRKEVWGLSIKQEQTGALRHFDDDKPRNYVLAERFPCLAFRRYEEVWTRRISAREEHSHATRLTRINAPDDAAAGAAARSRKRPDFLNCCIREDLGHARAGMEACDSRSGP
ncbi:hypothetical protein B0H14DRAFT_2577624 [Mycena olivaceomarginata]|nr:hypothetical protein B0H14DRAFT_2577624 [Mycena olivaceomarginata]